VAIRALVVSNGAIIGAGGEGMAVMWDIETGKCIFQHRYGHHRLIRCLIPIGNETYASGSEDCSLSIWDPRSLYPVALLSGHTDTVLSLCLGQQNCLISGSEDGTIAIWDIRAGKRLEKGVIGERVNDVEMWNGQVLCAGQGLSVYETGKMRKIQLEEGEILKVKALPTDLIYTSSRSCRLSIWSPPGLP
jgi:WD40 repeat protein